jgi:hypothetical protein
MCGFECWDRILGAVIGALVSLLALALGLLLDLDLVTGIALYGIPIGAIVGFLMAAQALDARSLWRPAFLSAVVAILVVVIGLVAGSVFQSIATGSSSAIAVYLGAPFILFFAFVVGMPVALPIALIGVGLLRLVRRPSARPRNLREDHDLAQPLPRS